ncbi:MAG: ParB/RepB/Spo0J family partition protein [Candidatus Buchananbacteria bacterium]|nr:ParB/RepB/Spo0J family partition protein [Candidatus Buchananbacteria bacterium]
MSNRPSGLGRGLGSLIPSKIKTEILPANSAVKPKEETVQQIDVDAIETNPHQPRTEFNHDALEELTNSIKEHGILQPLILTKIDGGYQLVAGERRLRAAKMLDLETVPAIVREIKDQQKLELALVENIQRQDLNPIEEAISYQRLMDEFSLTQDQVAKKVGKSRTVVTNLLRLLNLPTEVQKGLIDGKINYSTARVIAGLPDDQQLTFFNQVLKNDLTVRAVEGQAQKIAVKRHFRKSKDPDLRLKEETLEKALGTKVTIKKSGETGQIVIEFYSPSDLDDLINKINRSGFSV